MRWTQLERGAGRSATGFQLFVTVSTTTSSLLSCQDMIFHLYRPTADNQFRGQTNMHIEGASRA